MLLPIKKFKAHKSGKGLLLRKLTSFWLSCPNLFQKNSGNTVNDYLFNVLRDFARVIVMKIFKLGYREEGGVIYFRKKTEKTTGTYTFSFAMVSGKVRFCRQKAMTEACAAVGTKSQFPIVKD